MHIHKIDSNTHKEFLSQNRKDPITGDLIQSHDEVVFCASCKSVFLLDTWIYLDEKHCEQSETVEKFPSSSVIHLKIEESILFFQALNSDDGNKVNFPVEVKKSPWVREQTKLSPIQGIFNNFIIQGIKIMSWAIGIILFLVYQSPIVIFAFLFTFILQITEMLHNWYFGNQLDSAFRAFRGNTFYITNKSICFSDAYGINRYILSAKDIKQITFYEKNISEGLTYCVVEYQEEITNKRITFNIPKNTFNNTISFFNSLKSLSTANQIPIRINSSNKNTLSITQRTIDEGYNFRLRDMNR
ncbi:hypothetical protein WAF17_01920 [Bernardetia sp. ABR2-2B]|uniref:hypothetical protein n=1 Tax=Bernardetia sp. ABR2-2B TaxID=3127472 RepID=UPI0030CF57E6